MCHVYTYFCTCWQLIVLKDANTFHLVEHRIVRSIDLVTTIHITSADESRFASRNKS